jgi:hypothetical protein
MALTDNLLAYYKLDESSGDAVDSVGGFTLTNTNVTYGTGKINNGAVFNDAGDNLTSSSVTSSSAFTTSVWFKVGTMPSQCGIVDRYTTTGWRIWSGTTWNAILLTVNATSWTYALNPVSGTWYNLAWTFSSGTALLYLNGVLVDTKTGLTLTGVTNLTIGNTSVATKNKGFDGVIDEVAVWSRVLSANEISDVYRGGLGNQYPFTSMMTITM